MPPQKATSTTSTNQVDSTNTNDEVDSTIVGEVAKGARPAHELLLGLAGIITGLILPPLGLVLSLATISKGTRQSKKVLLLLGVIGILATSAGLYGYYALWNNDGPRSESQSSQKASESPEETDPDGFDAI